MQLAGATRVCMKILSDNMRGSLMMTAAMAGFTLNDTCMKAVTATMPLYQAIFLRGLLTIALLVAFSGYLGGLKFALPRRDAVIISIRTLAEVGSTVTFLTALMHMPLANLSAIMQSQPLAITLAAAIIFRERIGWRRILAIGIGFIGVMMIVKPGTESFTIWAAVGVLCVLIVVVRDLSTRQLSPAVNAVTVAFHAATAVTGLALLIVPFSGWEPVGLREAAAIAAASVFLIAGYLFIVAAMRIGEIGVIAPFRYTALVFALILGWLIFRQLPGGWTMAGALIVVATGIYTFYRERTVAKRAAAAAAISVARGAD